MLAKRFFYVSAALLCLTLAYHLGSSNAIAQSRASGTIRQVVVWGGTDSGKVGTTAWVLTDGDDIYAISENSAPTVAQGKGWKKFNLGVLR